jgi:hypothetical protein
MLLLWAVPMIHAYYFGNLFFQRSEHQTAIFHWNARAWLFGEDSAGKDMLYSGLTYFAWVPLLVITAIIGMSVINVFFVRAIFYKK